MEEVEVKGKKQMMFLGMPTYEGSLRFADVSHLQSVRKNGGFSEWEIYKRLIIIIFSS